MSRVEILDTQRDPSCDPEGGRWVTWCSRHHQLVNHETRALARSAAREPEEWCEACRALHLVNAGLEAGLSVEQAEQAALDRFAWSTVKDQDQIELLRETGDWPSRSEYRRPAGQAA